MDSAGTSAKEACASCGGPARGRCGWCHAVYYCNVTCQKRDWADHRARCMPPSAPPKPAPRLVPPPAPPGLCRFTPRFWTESFTPRCVYCEGPPVYECARCFKAFFCSDACRAKVARSHAVGCYKVDQSRLDNAENVAYREAFEINLFSEYWALKTVYGKKDASDLGSARPGYQRARRKMYRALVSMVEADPVAADEPELRSIEATKRAEKFRRDIRTAGEMLHAIGGMEKMHDGLLWSFIPRRYHRDIDYIWDGIGEWRC